MTLPTSRKESSIEAAFARACRRYGGDPLKFTSPGRAGVPDRIVVWGAGVTTYAEIKREKGGKVSDLQAAEIGKLLQAGHLAMVIRSELDIALFVKLSLERVMKP